MSTIDAPAHELSLIAPRRTDVPSATASQRPGAFAPTRLHLAPAPRTEPPFDDEQGPAGGAVRPQSAPTDAHQQALPYLCGTSDPRPPLPPPLQLVGRSARRTPVRPAWGADDDDDERGRRCGSQGLPDPRSWVARLAQALVEVESGRRPWAQLVRWTSEEVCAQVRARGAACLGGSTSRPEPPRDPSPRAIGPRIRSVHLCTPEDGIVEAATVVVDAGRATAVCLRLEGVDHRWLVTVYHRIMPGSDLSRVPAPGRSSVRPGQRRTPARPAQVTDLPALTRPGCADHRDSA